MYKHICIYIFICIPCLLMILCRTASTAALEFMMVDVFPTWQTLAV